MGLLRRFLPRLQLAASAHPRNDIVWLFLQDIIKGKNFLTFALSFCIFIFTFLSRLSHWILFSISYT